MKKRWKVKRINKELGDVLVRELNILPLTAQLLINRGLVDADKAFSFLKPELKDLHDPFLLKDMDLAVERISTAIRRGERIVVYGDYDVDGTTSTALLRLFFSEIGVDVGCHIPDRLRDGYGLNAGAVKRLAAEGVTLVITVDCGSSNVEEVRLARTLGVDVIVTDHHEMPKEPPPAYAILNPKQSGCAFPFKGLAGVGVAFNLVMALRARLRSSGWFTGGEPNLKKYLDLVSIGTVADIVPLLDENRIFVSHGLRELERGSRPGLKALMETAGVRPGRVDAGNIAFQLAPRINAAGRVANASMALDLLLAADHQKAARLATGLDMENTSRRRIEEETLKEALAMIGEGPSDRGIVLCSEGWHPGVIGIVASRLVERFARPAVLIALDGEVGRGSARGVKSFNILEGIAACGSLLERYGGHRAAAGLTVARDRVEEFRAEFVRYMNSTLTDDDLTPEIVLDAVVSLDEIDRRMISEMDALSPFGSSNREPLLCLQDARIMSTEVVGSRHLRFKVLHNGVSRSGIGFNLAQLHPMEGEGYGIAFSPFVDEWNGTKNLRLRIKDVEGACKIC
ncbi:MAG: single-stranded-DNA-specific exonuclease RecJ [Deltaproteobacteria bacterium]|nr:single-stranded-DNA-specific exonuclease RecJ [Deltaproteobacteria bacterium]